MLPPRRLGFVQKVHNGDSACYGVVYGPGGDAVDGRLRRVHQFWDVFDEVVV